MENEKAEAPDGYVYEELAEIALARNADATKKFTGSSSDHSCLSTSSASPRRVEDQGTSMQPRATEAPRTVTAARPTYWSAIQDAMETVTTSSSASSVDQAQKTYDQAVKDAVGSDTTTESGKKQ